MPKFHAVMLGETREEFGVSFEADNHEAADEYLKENYPESVCIQLEDERQVAEREERLYHSILRELDGDDYGDDDDEY